MRQVSSGRRASTTCECMQGGKRWLGRAAELELGRRTYRSVGVCVVVVGTGPYSARVTSPDLTVCEVYVCCAQEANLVTYGGSQKCRGRPPQ